MNLSNEFKEKINQSLFDTYNVKCISIEKSGMERVGNTYCIRHSFNGYLDNLPFSGALNFFLLDNGDCSFTVSGWFSNKCQDFMKSITKNNSYLQAIEQVSGWLTSNFDKRIDNQIGWALIGSGNLCYQRGVINNIVISMTPSSTGKLKIIQSSAYKYHGLNLLHYSFLEKDNALNFDYKIYIDDSIIEVNATDTFVDLDQFKKSLVHGYMSTYSRLNNTRSILSVDDFNTLSYQHIIDYLTVQQMQDIC
jgi:hypothetical protein